MCSFTHTCLHRKVADVEIAAASKIQALERQLQEQTTTTTTATDSDNIPRTPQQQQQQPQRIVKLEAFAQKSYEEINGLQGMVIGYCMDYPTMKTTP